MFAKLLPFELKLQIKQIGFWITFSIIFLLGFLFMSTFFGLGGTGGERIKINGAMFIAFQTGLFGMISIFFGAIYVVSGVMRDEAAKSLEMIHATPVLTAPMVLARFCGVLIATILTLTAGMLGMFVGQFAPWIDAETLGPPSLIFFAYPWLVFILINALFTSGIFTIVAALTRQRTMVYVSAIGLFILYVIATSFTPDVAPRVLVSLLDPFGVSALGLETEYWPAAEQNTRLVPLSGYVGLNRLVWGTFSLLLFALSFRLFRRGLGHSSKHKGGASVTAGHEEIALVLPANAPGRSGFPALWARLKFEYLTTVKSAAFLVLASLAIPLSGLVLVVIFFFSPQPPLATSLIVSNGILGGFAIPTILMTIFFGGEIIWRDRAAKMAEIIDTTPTSNWPIMIAKWLALFGLIATMILASIIVGVIFQLVMRDAPVELVTYLAEGFLGFAPRMMFFAVLAMFIQNFMPNRIIGMIGSGVIIMFFLFILPLFPFNHPLMDYGRTPGSGFSEMGGYSDVARFLSFLFYWGGLAGVFAAISVWLWRRGLDTALLRRLKMFRGNMSLPTSGLAAVSLIIFVAAGLNIYQGFDVKNDFETRSESEKRLADLEKYFTDEYARKLPKIRTVEADIQLYPSMRSADISGQYMIENVTGEPLRQLYLNVPISDVRKLEIDGAEWSHESDDEKRHARQGIRLYKFATPLPTGASTELRFDLHHPTPTLGGRILIRENGTFVNNLDMMPNLGVLDQRMRNPDRRRKYDLAELEESPSRDDEDARQSNFLDGASDYVTFDAKICTDAGQLPIAPGSLKRSYEENGRACADFEPREPILNFFAFVSADFTVREDNWAGPNGRDVKLAIYYHNKHDFNVELMIEAMKDSLDIYTETFGPFQFDTLRILEFPFGAFAQSFATTIPFSESIGFVMDPGDPDDNGSFDLATYVTLHEIGHQWFAHQIVGANTEGFNVLSEGLTENATLTAYETVYDWQKARRALERRSISGPGGYLLQRTAETGREEPLATARGGQQYLVYAKASWVFWGLKQYMGEDKMQAAIRTFVTDFGRKGPPYPTTAHLVDYLREAAGPDYQQLITDYWDRITLWDMKFNRDETNVVADGAGFKVTVSLELDKKVASEETGREISVTEAEYAKPEEPDDAEDSADTGDTEADEEEARGELLRPVEALNEWIEIGFYDTDPRSTLGDEWIRLERVRVTEMETTLSFNMDTRPKYIMLDPRRLLIERDVTDNRFRLPDATES